MDKDNTELTDISTMNYNDRLDGYGFGESECRDTCIDYKNDEYFRYQVCKDHGEGYRCHINEPWSTDEFGLRNQYGPVDQYVFRNTEIWMLLSAKK